MYVCVVAQLQGCDSRERADRVRGPCRQSQEQRVEGRISQQPSRPALASGRLKTSSVKVRGKLGLTMFKI